MKIEHSTINLTSQHAGSRLVTVEESLRAWVGQQRPSFPETQPGQANQRAIPSTIVNLSVPMASANVAAADAKTAANGIAGNDPKFQLLVDLIESLTGQKVRLFNPDDLNLSDAQIRSQQAAQQAADAAHQAQPAPGAARQGWGVEYDRHETIRESEQTRFSAQGIIKTADGKEIGFNLSLEMNWTFTQQSNVSIRGGD
ncbi:MAG: VCBS repeat-containing protein, partial [Nitrosomonadales bacterium]|nr:VCBS repeat-containing protein [Nitrosomonadales bacterium]